MTPHTLALEACRLLVETVDGWTPEEGFDIAEMRRAVELARQALDATPDSTTLNIGGGER